MRTYIIIPAHNEEKYLEDTIIKVKQYAKNIVVVDDGSCDATFEIAKKQNVVVLRHTINLGKGAALKTGCDYAVLSGAEKIVTVDADGQHDPCKIPEFLNHLEDSDIVFGYREKSDSMPKVLKFGNWFLNKLTEVLFNIKVNDTQCGYRAFRSCVYRKICWKSNDYSMESEMIARAGRHNLKYSQLPIKTIYNDRYKGTTVLDGFKIALNMVSWRFLR